MYWLLLRLCHRGARTREIPVPHERHHLRFLAPHGGLWSGDIDSFHHTHECWVEMGLLLAHHPERCHCSPLRGVLFPAYISSEARKRHGNLMAQTFRLRRPPPVHGRSRAVHPRSFIRRFIVSLDRCEGHCTSRRWFPVPCRPFLL
jgi:hypothetical protein